jgi:hypothetical protein
MKAIALNWWRHHEGINFADWNDILRENTFPFKIIPLPKRLINDHIQAMDGKPEKMKDVIKGYAKLLRQPLKQLDCKHHFFIKLISRSPKDTLADENNHGKPKPLMSVKDAVIAMSNSMRFFEDIVLLKYLPTASIVVRPYINFDPSKEWRVYIQDKRIIGISQYYYQSVFPAFDETLVGAIKDEIKEFIYSIVVPNMELSDYVADIVTGYDVLRKTTVLEINPYWMSDPCLFKSYNSFDRTIVWNKYLNVTSKIKI